MKMRALFRAVCLLLVTAVLTVSVSLAADAGSSGDPLVTLSYLNETFLNTVLTKVDAKITERNTALNAQVAKQIAEARLGGSGGTAVTGTASTYEVVTLSSGQTLKLDLGAEVLLRVGTATCVASSAPGLIDSTGGSSINQGAALVKNHLYLATIEDRGVRATAATVRVMVRGGYSIA